MVADRTPLPLIGGRFALRACLQRGAKGELYDAFDRATGERVSLRLLHGDGGTGAQRFTREVEQLAALQHPGIVRHVAYGITPAGQRYVATEWLEGEDLAQRLRREPMGVAEVVAMGIALARALAAAHERGMLHLDLKPVSVLLAGFRASRAKLVDLARARARDPVRELTRGSSALVTRGYVAPELALGERLRVGPRTDLFALGCVLYEALAGVAAFEAPDAQEVVRRILFVDPPPIETRTADVPPELAAIVSALLAKDPDDRPSTAEQVARELEDIPCIMSPVDLARAGDMNVLLEGPGWDAHGFAERLHEGSRRHDKPYVAVYGAALRVADLAHVSGGTLLLQEPEKLGAEAQRMLARFVEVRAVSSAHGPVHADVRIVTHAPLLLRQAVSVRRFRPDLYRALAAVRLTAG